MAIEVNRGVVYGILDNLGECGVKFDGTFIDHEGDTFEIEGIERELESLNSDVRKLREMLAWAKTVPNVNE